LALLVVAVAAVVTPLGLYDNVLPSRFPQQVPFPHHSDLSPMGYGTPPRSELGFNRKCGGLLPVVCPGSDTVISYSQNDTSMTANLPYGYASRSRARRFRAFSTFNGDHTPPSGTRTSTTVPPTLWVDTDNLPR
jgi:hypothetical protein